MSLKTELTDARYTSMTDVEAAADLNTPRIARNRISMSGREVRAAVVDAEYDVLAAAEKAQLIALTASDDLDPFGLPENIIKDIFGPSDTLDALALARVETISQAVALGIRSPVRVGDVIRARRV